MRDRSDRISDHFCVNNPNGTTEIFRREAVVQFPPWIEQKRVVEREEEVYDDKVPECEHRASSLDEQTAECDALQFELEEAACRYTNKVTEVRNAFAQSWSWALTTYNTVMQEVHCLEVDRWKEWRTLATVQCLLDRTTERNGRPCDESTSEITIEVAACEEVRSTADISTLMIAYHTPADMPPDHRMPIPENRCETGQYPNNGCPAVHKPAAAVAPCSAEYLNEEGYDAMWIPPTSPFDHENSHCNPRRECGAEAVCAVVPVVPQCAVMYGAHPPASAIPRPEDECSQATRDHLAAGSFNDDGHYTPHSD